jgi:hypothetical protein
MERFVFDRSSTAAAATAAMVAATTITLACAASAGSAGAADGAAARQAFKVTSTLDGKQVLPHRIRWIAHPAIPRSRVARVEFLIDGRLRWVERNAPYVYGDDSDWLVTSWLAPGRHRFSVRATAKGGRKATHAITARVVASPAPPVELANGRVASRRATGGARTRTRPSATSGPSRRASSRSRSQGRSAVATRPRS